MSFNPKSHEKLNAAAMRDRSSGQGLCGPIRTGRRSNGRGTKAFQNQNDSFVRTVGWDPTQRSALPVLLKTKQKKKD